MVSPLLNNRLKHCLIIFCFTVLTLLVAGYRFGDGDQNSHLPFLLKTVNPQLYPNNPFLDLRFYHYSYFWNLFVPFLRSGLVQIEILFFAVFLLSLFLFFLVLYELLFLFLQNRNISYVSLFLFVIPAFSFSVIPTHDTYLVNRSFTLPFLLLSILFFLKNYYLVAFSLLGIAYNLHALSTIFVLTMFGVALFLLRKKISAVRLFFYLLSFLIFALPVFFWKFNTSSLDLSIHRDWYSLVDKGALGHMFHLFSLNPPTILLSLFGFGNTVGFLLVLKERMKEEKLMTAEIKLVGFFIAIYLLLFVCFLTAEFFPVTIAIQFQLSRAGNFIPILSYPYFFAHLYRLLKKRILSFKGFGVLLGTTALSGSLITALLIYPLLLKKKPGLKKYVVIICLFSLSLTVLAGFVLIKTEEWLPGIYIYPRKTSWHDVQLWAKENTAIDDNFLTLPGEWGHFSSDFLLLSQRNTVVTLGQLMEIAFHPSYIPEWRERFENVIPGAIERFNGNFLYNKKMVNDVYSQRTSDEFMKTAEKYYVSYIVVKKPKVLDLGIAYENEDFRVYKTKIKKSL